MRLNLQAIMLSLLNIMQEHRQKQEETLQKQESRIQILEEKEDTDSYIASEEETYLGLPVVYINLLAKYCFETFPDDDKVDYSRWRVEEEIPSIDLTITYLNVYNKKEEADLSIKFKPVDYHTLDGQAGACMFQLQTETDTQ